VDHDSYLDAGAKSGLAGGAGDPRGWPGYRMEGWIWMDAARAFEVALDHYRKGNDCLHYPVAVQMEEQALHLARATAHFSAGSLALALAQAQLQGDGQEAGEQVPAQK
jgi:hypothetical protein